MLENCKMPLHIRLDHEALNPNVNLQSSIVKWCTNPSQMLAVMEQRSKSEPEKLVKKHYHIYVPENHLSIPTIRTRIREMCSEIATTSKKHNYYRIENVKISELAIQGYLLKFEDNEIIYQGSDVEIEIAKKEYQKKTIKKINEKNRVLEIEKFLQFEKTNTPVEIANSIRKYYHKNNMVLHKAEIVKLTQTIWYKRTEDITLYDEQVVEEAQCEIGEIQKLRHQVSCYKRMFQEKSLRDVTEQAQRASNCGEVELQRSVPPKAV